MILKQFPNGATIPQRPRETRLRLSCTREDIPDLFKRLCELRNMFYHEAFAWMVGEVAAHKRLKLEVIGLHHRTDGFWGDDQGKTRSFNINMLRPNIRGVAESLAYELLGEGNLSHLFRLLVRFYAVRHQLIEEPTRRPRKQKMKLEHDKKIQRKPNSGLDVSFTIDKQTDQYIKDLVPYLEKKRLTVLRTIIQEIGTDEKRIKELERFYRTAWTQPTGEAGIPQLARFNYTPELEALLVYLSERILGKRNKSGMVRLLVQFYYVHRAKLATA